jgi:hypothetical protein
VTLLLCDVAVYQGDLQPADVKRAGFFGVNLKVSHGLGQTSVHPELRQWVTDAATLGLAVSTFHFLTGEASGAAQAKYCFGRLQQLGLQYATAHQVDCESDATEAILRDYLTTMTELAGRPSTVYSARWWWAPRGWKVADLTPFLWGVPNSGTGSAYPGTYPGDTSPLWTAGWGGFPTLSIMQYAVEPLSYPDGTRGSINVSKSAIRDPAVWQALTGGGPMASPAYYSWVAAGRPWKFARPITAVGDRLRAHGYTVYYQGNDAHLQKATPEDHTPFSATGWPGGSPYPYCMAMDIMPPAAGAKSDLTGQPLPSLQQLAAQLRADKIAGLPAVGFVKYINWEPEGNNTGPCYHDSWMPGYARISSADRGHIHVSARTDYYLSGASDDYDLVARVMGDEDLVTTQAEFNTLMDAWIKSRAGAKDGTPEATARNLVRAWPWQYVGGGLPAGTSTLNALNTLLGRADQLNAAVQGLAGRDFTDEGAIVQGVLAGLHPEAVAETVAEAVVSALSQQQAEDVVTALVRRIRTGTGTTT